MERFRSLNGARAPLPGPPHKGEGGAKRRTAAPLADPLYRREGGVLRPRIAADPSPPRCGEGAGVGATSIAQAALRHMVWPCPPQGVAVMSDKDDPFNLSNGARPLPFPPRKGEGGAKRRTAAPLADLLYRREGGVLRPPIAAEPTPPRCGQGAGVGGATIRQAALRHMVWPCPPQGGAVMSDKDDPFNLSNNAQGPLPSPAVGRGRGQPPSGGPLCGPWAGRVHRKGPPS